MSAVPYSFKQGESQVLGNPALQYAVGGDNPTPYYIHFPYMAPGRQWVFPYTYNFMYPVEVPEQIAFTTNDTPAGYPPAPTSTALINLTAYDTPQDYNAGTQNAASPVASQAIAGPTTLQNLNDSISIPCGGATFVTFSGWRDFVSGAIATEGTTDNTNWFFVPCFLWSTSIQIGGAAFWGQAPVAGTNTAGALVAIATAGLTQVRVRVTSQLGFSLTLTARAVPGAGIPTSFGQEFSSNSMPVVIASDQSAFPTSDTIPPADLTAFSAPAAGTQAVVTFAAVIGKRIQIDSYTGQAFGGVGAAATNLDTQIIDGASQIWSDGCGIAGAGSSGRAAMGPRCSIAGSVGNAVKVQLTAGVANVIEHVSATAYKK